MKVSITVTLVSCSHSTTLTVCILVADNTVCCPAIFLWTTLGTDAVCCGYLAAVAWPIVSCNVYTQTQYSTC